MNWLLIHYCGSTFLGKDPKRRRKEGWEGKKEGKREGGREGGQREGRKLRKLVSVCLPLFVSVCLSLILSESGIPFTKNFYTCEPSRYCLRGSHCTVEWFFWHLYKAEVIFVGGCYDNVQTTESVELCGR